MPVNEIPESLQEVENLEQRIAKLATQLYGGHGGASELASAIDEQAKIIVRRRIEAARKRALLAA